MSKQPLNSGLWTPRPLAETIAVYSDWADSYDADLAKRGYQTPTRIAAALRAQMQDDGPILDFGCGTGLSGIALQKLGFTPLHGTDITRNMVEKAEAKGVYEKLWIGESGEPPCQPGTYKAIVATGVISLGAAPAETMDTLLQALGPGDLFALSFNDPTLADGSYDKKLNALVESGGLEILSRQHGPHLDDMDMGADVIVTRRL